MKIILLRDSHTVILKGQRRVNIKVSEFDNNANNSYEIWPKSLDLIKKIVKISIKDNKPLWYEIIHNLEINENSIVGLQINSELTA